MLNKKSKIIRNYIIDPEYYELKDRVVRGKDYISEPLFVANYIKNIIINKH